ncbi:MAG: DNA polymerase III, subunit gamma and tau [Flavobacteriaceae bacterium]|nr:DNA polymerase III, subunit gamma and tau [Flavobacteriaceae bacterium]
MNKDFSASALRYRPQKFQEVVGQDAIVKTLLNAIKNDSLAQALLFCGPRGVGKTTCARILAKEINKVEADYDYNIFELDAANNAGVEDIRTLIDQFRIPPQIGKFKVYIIDEVHMLSKQAFNAFLKSLEEPPNHVIFILATTEKNKIIPTILSRCQIFEFKKIDQIQIEQSLRKICKENKIDFEDEALNLIASKSDGAMRDALVMFDRLVTFTNGKLSLNEVSVNLNTLDLDTYFNFSDLISSSSIPDILSKYNEIVNKGFDGLSFISGLSRHYREILISKFADSQKISIYSDSIKLKYEKFGKKIEIDEIIGIIDIINDCEINYKKITDERVHVELCLLRLASYKEDKKKNFLIPTKDFMSIVDTAKNKTEIFTEKKDNKLFDLPNNQKAISTFSLASIDFKNSISNDNEIEEVNLPNKKFSKYDLLKSWKSFCEIQEEKGNINISSVLKMNEPSLERENIIIKTVNQINKKEIESIRGDILSYLKKDLENHSINLKVIIEKNSKKNGTKSLNNEEKIKSMIKSNPKIKSLIEEFNLKF